MKREHIIESLLPSGYRQLEYIEGTGTQYIDTGVLSGELLDFEVTFKPTDTGFNYWIFGCRYAYEDNEEGILWETQNHSSNPLRFRYIKNYWFETFQYISTDNFHEIKVTNNNYYVDNQFISSFTKNVFNRKCNVLINGGWNSSSNVVWPGNASWKAAKLWYNGELVRDYIPALRISDNKPGLYDLCGSICPLTNTPFYINAGTGEFLYA